MKMRAITRLLNLRALSVSPAVSKRILRLPSSLAGGRYGYSTQPEDSRPISRFPIPYKKDLPYDIVELMEEVENKSGFLPNVFKAMAHRPDEFRAFFAYYDVLLNKESGNLSKADKELIIVATSANNRCPYCVTAHGALHRIYSKNNRLADQVVVNWNLADLSQRECAMLEFALAIANAENITENHFTKLEVHGFDREDAWDIAMITAYFAMANRIAHLMDLRPNQEFYSLGRIPRVKSEESKT
ncbi:hypothetical protein XENTR_v10001496 [Xenopus tropicalis]|uniref:Uncharacterized CMD superfamily member n=1 Tax=Xenopus tropicalis TaxID=8364 RepID=A0A6I8PY78_XENTR|nr:uncharacterized protein xbg100487674 [Xenopus tropicalis]KAE8632264.1 hypothetical protein XENTR_v10001496 [Xenopus tropicalis]|eukprot:XP_004910953.1 PREDICTED: uncharacterized protein LOC100487674 [Xenopus tropicalis]